MRWIRKTVFALCLLIGVAYGLALGLKDDGDWKGTIFMVVLLGTAGALVGSFLSDLGLKDEAPARRGRRRRARKDRGLSADEAADLHEHLQEVARSGGIGMSAEERLQNYWRDKDQLPFTFRDDEDFHKG